MVLQLFGEQILMSSNSFHHKSKPILERMRLTNKIALVTGGGQGIGEGFCHALGEAGAKIVVVDKIIHRANCVVNNLLEKEIDAFAIEADVSSIDDVNNMINQTIQHFGKLDIAVNNAGIGKNSAAEVTTKEEWDGVLNINLNGVFFCCQAEARVMFDAKYGKIINTASMSSMIVPHPQKQAAYNTSKAGVVQLTKSLACEWIDRGISVNCISPGIVQTSMLETKELQPLLSEWLNQIPAKRFATIEDLQGAIVFLASEASDYITGQNLVIDGGQTLW